MGDSGENNGIKWQQLEAWNCTGIGRYYLNPYKMPTNWEWLKIETPI